jgi:hypothetical protein
MTVEQRLTRLERLQAEQDTPPWPEVNAAFTRYTARARLALGERLGTEPDHVAMVSARETLRGDTLEQERTDQDLIARWRRTHPTPDPGDARQQLAAKLEAIARRLREAHHAP